MPRCGTGSILLFQICKSLSIIILGALKNIQLPLFAKPWLMDSRFRGSRLTVVPSLVKRKKIYNFFAWHSA
jgi:hypothetical protein